MTHLGWRLLERQLGRWLPPDRVAPILGDLAADADGVARRHGRWRARLWLLREALSIVAAYRRRTPLRRTWMDRLRSDVVHAWRSVRARPLAALSTIGVLALGIGLVSSMFALADPYVTRPLPFADADRLATLSIRAPAAAEPPALEAWRARTDLLAGLATYGATESVLVAARDGPVPLRLLSVSAEYLEVLGVAAPRLADWRARPGSRETPVVLTPAVSRRLAEAGAPGTLLVVADEAGGLTSRGFRVQARLGDTFLFPSSSQNWDGLMPLPDGAPLAAVERSPSGLPVTRINLSVLARLQPRVTLDQVEAALSMGPRTAERVLPREGYAVSAASVVDQMTARLRPLAMGALGAGLLVLIVCAANVANLLIARGAFRRGEFAAREALGASRFDLGRLVLVELGLLTGAGLVAGLALTSAVLAASAAMIPAQYVVLGAPAVSPRVIWFACAAGSVVMAVGLLPALAAWRAKPATLFAQAATGEPRGLRAARFAMTAAQTTLAVVLLVAATLMARSYVNLLVRDPGYAGDIFVVGVRYDSSTIAPEGRVEVTIDRLGRLDGVSGAAAILGPLVESIGGGRGGQAFLVDGRRVPGRTMQVSAGFFQTAGGTLVDGRLLTPADAGRAVVVSEAFARECCPERSPVGRRVEQATNAEVRSFEIVGVARDVLDQALDQAPVSAVYLPIGRGPGVWVSYVLRAGRPTAVLASSVEREIQAMDRQARVTGGGLMRDRLMRSIRDRSFATLMVAFFAVAAVGVSAAGLVGVVGSVVARRTREIAIRMAIGARKSDVRRLVTREAAAASTVGAALGLAAGGWLSRTMESLLFGVAPADPIAMAMAAVALVVIVVLSAWVPARRAVRLSPADALRVE